MLKKIKYKNFVYKFEPSEININSNIKKLFNCIK